MAAKRSTKKKSSPKKKAAVAAKPAAKKAGKRSSRAAKPSGADDRLSQLERLVEMMVAKDVVEVELEEAGARWRVRRTEPQAVTYAAAPPMAMPAALPGAAPGAATPAANGDAGEAAAEPQGEVFKSPMLGTFYSAPSPDAESFVKLGDRVNADTTLCIVEAMKVMNEIKAEREFEVLEALVKNGEPVEFGQPLFLIR